MVFIRILTRCLTTLDNLALLVDTKSIYHLIFYRIYKISTCNRPINMAMHFRARKLIWLLLHIHIQTSTSGRSRFEWEYHYGKYCLCNQILNLYQINYKDNNSSLLVIVTSIHMFELLLNLLSGHLMCSFTFDTKIIFFRMLYYLGQCIWHIYRYKNDDLRKIFYINVLINCFLYKIKMEYCNSRLQIFQDAEVSRQYLKKNKSLDCSNIPLAVCHT